MMIIIYYIIRDNNRELLEILALPPHDVKITILHSFDTAFAHRLKRWKFRTMKIVSETQWWSRWVPRGQQRLVSSLFILYFVQIVVCIAPYSHKRCIHRQIFRLRLARRRPTDRLPSQKRLLCSICGDQRGARIGTTSGTCALTLVTTVGMAYFATKKVT